MGDIEVHKISVLGEGGVGKSAISTQLTKRQFEEEYDPTIEDSYKYTATIDGIPAKLEILDTAGQEEYRAMLLQWVRQGSGFILVYSITSSESFDRIDHYVNLIRESKEGDSPIVIFGNKCDLENERVVATSQGQAYANSLKVPFFETSAKTRINVEEGFFQLVRELRKRRAENNTAQKSGVEKQHSSKECCVLI